MTVWRRKTGDTNDTIVATLGGIDSLSGVSLVEAHVAWPATGAASTLTATVTDSAACEVTVSLGSWITTAAAGVWNLEIQVVAAGITRTWETDTLELSAQLA